MHPTYVNNTPCIIWMLAIASLTYVISKETTVCAQIKANVWNGYSFAARQYAIHDTSYQCQQWSHSHIQQFGAHSIELFSCVTRKTSRCSSRSTWCMCVCVCMYWSLFVCTLCGPKKKNTMPWASFNSAMRWHPHKSLETHRNDWTSAWVWYWIGFRIWQCCIQIWKIYCVCIHVCVCVRMCVCFVHVHLCLINLFKKRHTRTQQCMHEVSRLLGAHASPLTGFLYTLKKGAWRRRCQMKCCMRTNTSKHISTNKQNLRCSDRGETRTGIDWQICHTLTSR